MDFPKVLRQFPNTHKWGVVAVLLMISLVFLWPHSPKPKQQEVRLAIEVSSQPQETADETTIEEPLTHWESTLVKAGDSLSVIFSHNNLSASSLVDIVASAPKNVLTIRPKQKLQWVRAENNRVQEFQIEISPLAHHSFKRLETGKYQYELIERDADYQPKFGFATINSSLFVDGAKAGIPEQVLFELANIFGWDIDFALDIRQGDHFSLIYDEIHLDGEKIGIGNILVAKFFNNGRELTAVRYKDKNGRTDYYTANGNNMRKAFLRNPIDFTRISSRFTTTRRHPVLHTIVRAHKGTDYAAPTGTPIKASGDGKIIFAGRKGGYGNAVVLQHGARYQTLYAHMSSFHRNTRVGRLVKQGQVIGYVGSTGLATGPHLHYEFRVDGVHRDPLKVVLPKADTIAASQMADFKQHSQSMMSWLNSFATETTASSEAQ